MPDWKKMLYNATKLDQGIPVSSGGRYKIVLDATHWVEIELVDAADEPVAGERYRVTFPDESVVEGKLDDQGLAHVETKQSGNCEITFPDLDGRSWEVA